MCFDPVEQEAPTAAESSVADQARRGLAPDLLADANGRLTRLERFNISAVRSAFTRPMLSRVTHACQRTIGTGWIRFCTRNLVDAHGLDRLPPFDPDRGFIVVSNHRSYFDLFVISQVLIDAGMRNRMLYPVRSGFFYDHPLGFAVNGLMSFWSMYPPIFRDRKRAHLNLTGLHEIAHMAETRGFAIGIHPEGTRNKNNDPYTFLPAQSGVGRLIYGSRSRVIPVFINGLGNDLKKQVAGNFNGQGDRLILVFGEPVDFGDMRDAPSVGRTYRALANHSLEAIGALGQEEKALRAAL